VRNLLSQAGGSHPFSSWLTLFYPSGRLIPSPPSPVQGRNNDSPARKCRVSKGSRLRAPRAPLCECLCRGGRLVRPGRAQARQDPNGCSRGRHDSGRTRLRRTRLGRARLSVVPPSPFNLCHSERSEESAFLRTHYASRNSEIQIPPAPFRGGITIAPHVSAGSATDRDHARFARHHPRRIGLQPRQFDHPEQQDDPLREPSCECLCRGGRLVRPGRAKLGSIFQPCKRTSRLGNCVDWEGLDWAEHDFSRATKTL